MQIKKVLNYENINKSQITPTYKQDNTSFSGGVNNLVKPVVKTEEAKQILQKILKYVEIIPDNSKLQKPITVHSSFTSLYDNFNNVFKIMIDKTKPLTHVSVENGGYSLNCYFDKKGQMEYGIYCYKIGRTEFSRTATNKRRLTETSYGFTEEYLPTNNGEWKQNVKTAASYTLNSANQLTYHLDGSLAEILLEFTKLKTSIYAK